MSTNSNIEPLCDLTYDPEKINRAWTKVSVTTKPLQTGKRAKKYSVSEMIGNAETDHTSPTSIIEANFYLCRAEFSAFTWPTLSPNIAPSCKFEKIWYSERGLRRIKLTLLSGNSNVEVYRYFFYNQEKACKS